MNDELPTVYYPMSVLRDLMPELREQERAREAGITYDAVRAILADWRLDDGDSFGRTIERLRSLALAAAERMSEAERHEAHQCRLMAEEAAHAENLNAADLRAERAAVVALLRESQRMYQMHRSPGAESLVRNLADIIERGEHRREEER